MKPSISGTNDTATTVKADAVEFAGLAISIELAYHRSSRHFAATQS